MKPITCLMAAVMLTLVLIKPGAASASESVYSWEMVVPCSAGDRLVKVVYVDLKDPNIKVEAALACGQVGQVDELANIAGQLGTSRREVLAAVNGTYFNPYGGLPLPWGTIQKDGEYVHIGSNGTAVGFSADNRMFMDNLNVTITGTASQGRSWYAWGLNHTYDQPEAAAIFTRAYGTYTGDHPYTSVIVERGKVTQIKGGGAAIPADGFVVVTGNRDLLSRFKTGDPAVYQMKLARFPYTLPAPHEEQPWNEAVTTLSAGPTLMRDGKIVVNAEAEGFTEAKITVNRGLRNLIGERADHMLVIATVPNVTVREEAEIARNLGLVNAMNLDGSASAGIWYRGSYLTTPGRLLSNALVITGQRKDPGVQVLLDQRPLSFDVEPMIDQGRALVPLRGIFEAVGAEVVWHELTKTVTAHKDGKRIDLQIGSVVAHVNDKTVILDVPARIVEGRTLVPLRFVGESLGLKVDWNEGSRTAALTTK